MILQYGSLWIAVDELTADTLSETYGYTSYCSGMNII